MLTGSNSKKGDFLTVSFIFTKKKEILHLIFII